MIQSKALVVLFSTCLLAGAAMAADPPIVEAGNDGQVQPAPDSTADRQLHMKAQTDKESVRLKRPPQSAGAAGELPAQKQKPSATGAVTASKSSNKPYSLRATFLEHGGKPLSVAPYHRLAEQAAAAYAGGNLAEAEECFREALKLAQQNPQLEPETHAMLQTNLAAVLRDEHQYKQAEALFGQAVELARKYLGQRQPVLDYIGNQYAALLRKTGRTFEANAVEQSAKSGFAVTQPQSAVQDMSIFNSIDRRPPPASPLPANEDETSPPAEKTDVPAAPPVVATAAAAAAPAASLQEPAPVYPQTTFRAASPIILRLTGYNEDDNTAYINYDALRMARQLENAGANVVLLLERHAARLGTTATMEFSIYGNIVDFKKLIAEIIQAGGRVVVNQYYANLLSVQQSDCLPGVEILPESELAKVIINCDKIVDYATPIFPLAFTTGAAGLGRALGVTNGAGNGNSSGRSAGNSPSGGATGRRR